MTSLAALARLSVSLACAHFRACQCFKDVCVHVHVCVRVCVCVCVCVFVRVHTSVCGCAILQAASAVRPQSTGQGIRRKCQKLTAGRAGAHSKQGPSRLRQGGKFGEFARKVRQIRLLKIEETRSNKQKSQAVLKVFSRNSVK